MRGGRSEKYGEAVVQDVHGEGRLLGAGGSREEGEADLLQRAELVVSDVPWLWGGRDRLRQVVGGFLNPVVG